MASKILRKIHSYSASIVKMQDHIAHHRMDAEEQIYSVPAIPSQNIHWSSSSSCNNFKYRMVSSTTVNSYSQCKF